MIRELLNETETRMKSAVTALENDLQTYRTGRASPHILDRLVVHVYGTDMPLNQLALVSVPEPQQLAIRPFDASSLSAIEKAILKSDLGLMPSNDGKLIRLNIPRLTEERRRDLRRQISGRVEDGRVAVRNIRHDTLKDLREIKNEKLCSEDEYSVAEKDLQELTNKYVAKTSEVGKQKEAEIMEV